MKPNHSADESRTPHRPKDGLADTLVQHPRADFYRALALFANDFFAVEAQAFDLLEA